MSDPNQGFQPPPPPAPPEKAPRPDKLLPIGIGIFVVGLIVIFLGWKSTFLPGGIGTGIAFAFWGLVLLAFSFIPLPQSKGDEEPPMSGLQKVTGIFFEPSRVFRNLRTHPHWLTAFLVIVVFNAIYTNAFVHRLTPERIAENFNEKIEQSPIKPPPERMAQAKEDNYQQLKQPIQRAQTTAKSFVGIFVFISILAALYLLGVLAFGGRINFWQAFAGILYAYVPIAVITKVVSLIILFVKDPTDVHPILGQETLVQDNLGILFKPAEHPALFVLASSIGVLSFYGLWLKAKALANAGTKVSNSSAWGVAITFWILGLLLGVIFASIFSSFMS
jgi:MFS family permease